MVPIQGRREWDVHLKTPDLIVPAYWTKQEVSRWRDLVSKRIDLVVHGSSFVWIMEITPKVSKAAIGGCLVYRNLYQKQFQPTKEIKLGIIVEVDDPAYHDVCEKLDISLWVV